MTNEKAIHSARDYSICNDCKKSRVAVECVGRELMTLLSLDDPYIIKLSKALA